ncbi:MAG: family 43 glycosylhydrolase [Reichenbachiella sp.]
MKKVINIACLLMVLLWQSAVAQNPLIQDQFTADPSARVFGDRVYIYPSHDILAEEGKGRLNWFCMEDYHVFSSDNLTIWTDHGMIVSQENVPWADPEGYSMWAPDCIERDGKYYFYFPSKMRNSVKGEDGFTIGVAVADHPAGPFVPQVAPIPGIKGIDPNVFIDTDANGKTQAYLYWSSSKIYGAPLKDNMLELAAEPTIIGDLPSKGHKEGPYMIKRKGIYYLTYPHVENKTERLEYAIGDNPLGPFTVKGVIMDESPTQCWTNHQSIIEYKGQWLLFYHHNDLSPQFDKSRSIMADSLFFEADGSIRKVTPSLRGVGVSQATDKVQIDRYSVKSNGATIAFNDASDTFKGWHIILDGANEWIEYRGVSFKKGLKSVHCLASSKDGAQLEIRSGGPKGSLIAVIEVPKSNDWNESRVELLGSPEGVQNLAIIVTKGKVQIDWVQFQ